MTFCASSGLEKQNLQTLRIRGSHLAEQLATEKATNEQETWRHCLLKSDSRAGHAEGLAAALQAQVDQLSLELTTTQQQLTTTTGGGGDAQGGRQSVGRGVEEGLEGRGEDEGWRGWETKEGKWRVGEERWRN